MSCAIGIGYGVDRQLVEWIGNAGNEFVDFALLGDDMRTKVINQLKQDHLEIPGCHPKNRQHFISNHRKKIENNTHICVEAEGRKEPIIIQLNSFLITSRAHKSLEYLFNNENIKTLLRKEQAETVI